MFTSSSPVALGVALLFRGLHMRVTTIAFRVVASVTTLPVTKCTGGTLRYVGDHSISVTVSTVASLAGMAPDPSVTYSSRVRVSESVTRPTFVRVCSKDNAFHNVASLVSSAGVMSTVTPKGNSSRD